MTQLTDFFRSDQSHLDGDRFRILVYPNITYKRDLEKDSYVVVIRNVIKVLSEKYDHLQFVLLLPYMVDSLKLPNVEQRVLDFPSYPNTMRCHFNASKVRAAAGDLDSYDLIYSHLPEHTWQLSQLTDVPILGYCHWYEVDENTGYEKRLLLNNLLGTLQMQSCGVNSEWLKSLVIEKSGEHFNPSVKGRLRDTIKSHPLGILDYDFSDSYEHGTVIFNHRPNKYTGWKWFVKKMDEMWNRRQDFKVYTTLASIDRPWNEKVTLDSREEYLDFLKSVHFGVGCFRDYSAWSISTTDGLSRGTPYILPNGLCYPEMVGSDYPLLYDNDEGFVEQFESLLDSPSKTKVAQSFIKQNIEDFLWRERVLSWEDWDEIFRK